MLLVNLRKLQEKYLNDKLKLLNFNLKKHKILNKD